MKPTPPARRTRTFTAPPQPPPPAAPPYCPAGEDRTPDAAHIERRRQRLAGEINRKNPPIGIARIVKWMMNRERKKRGLKPIVDEYVPEFDGPR